MSQLVAKPSAVRTILRVAIPLAAIALGALACQDTLSPTGSPVAGTVNGISTAVRPARPARPVRCSATEPCLDGSPCVNRICQCGGTGTRTFDYTAGSQTFVVPQCVTSITVDVQGGSGGAGSSLTSQGGKGGRVQATLAVTPGTTYQIDVGGAGTNGGAGTAGIGGFNGGANGASYPGQYGGGGGGGASDMRQAPYTLADRIFVGGGGGGGAYNTSPDYERGGHGGTTTGECGYSINVACGEGAGSGGTQTTGGTGGTYGGYCTAPNGTLGNGGAGGVCTNSGGGGGGGLYGGGGGVWAGGGGGSNFVTGSATNVTQTQGFRTGEGTVIISW